MKGSAYPSLDELYARMASRLGVPAEVYGQSVEGQPLKAFHIPGTGDRPVLIVAAIHGLEFIGSLVAEGVAQHRLGLESDVDTWVVPVANPDAYRHCWEQGGQGTVAEFRKNARGVDLNRNFPLPHGARRWPLWVTGSPNPKAATYHGPSPLSEPEVSALASLIQRIEPHALASLHSFGGALIHARVRDRPAWKVYGKLSDAYREARGSGRIVRLGSRFVDVFAGELEDWAHHEAGCWSTCIELFPLADSLRQGLRAKSVFNRFNPVIPKNIVQLDVPAVWAWLLEARRHARPNVCQIGQGQAVKG